MRHRSGLKKTGAEEDNPISEEVCANDDFSFTPAKMESVPTCLIPVAVSRTMHDPGGSELSAASAERMSCVHRLMECNIPDNTELENELVLEVVRPNLSVSCNTVATLPVWWCDLLHLNDRRVGNFAREKLLYRDHLSCLA